MPNRNINRARKNATQKIPVKQQAVHILNLSSYTKPEVYESKKNDWVEYGDQNDYFQYLIDRYNLSLIHI